VPLPGGRRRRVCAAGRGRFQGPHQVDPGQTAEPGRCLPAPHRPRHPRGRGKRDGSISAGRQTVDAETLTMHALLVIYTIWLREFKAFIRERARIIGMIGQPLLYLLIVGQGIASGLTLNGTQGFDYLKFIYPGILGMSVLFTSIFSALSIIWDREFGFLK